MHLVRIRIADAGRIALHAEKIMDGIPQYYVQQYRRIKKKQEADQELAAGFLLKKYLNVSSDAQFVRLEHGKPVLKSGNSYFNLSHSGEYTVLAAADIDIGVDIEQIKDVHWPTVQKIFTAEQREQLERTGDAGRPELFAKYWTECEAVLKLKGTGFAAETVTSDTGPGRTGSGDGRLPLKVYSFRYKEYMIACAAYGAFYVSVEEDRSYLYM